MEDRLDKLLEKVEGVMNEVKGVRSEMDTRLSDMEKTIKSTVEDAIKQSRSDITKEIEDTVGTKTKPLEDEIKDLRDKLNNSEHELAKIRSLVDVPFNPDRSVVIYGLVQQENESLQDCVTWLLKDVLQCTVKIKNLDRRQPRDTGKIGVVLLECDTVYEKVNILRAKGKCAEWEDTQNVVIKGCESHDARVSRMNNKLLMNMLEMKDYTITAHGIIKLKESNSEGDSSGTRGGSNPGEAAVSATGPVPPQQRLRTGTGNHTNVNNGSGSDSGVVGNGGSTRGGAGGGRGRGGVGRGASGNNGGGAGRGRGAGDANNGTQLKKRESRPSTKPPENGEPPRRSSRHR